MRICRILQTLPSDASPGGNIGLYRLTQYIEEPCLLVTGPADSYPPLPPHATLAPLRRQDTELPARLRARVFGDGAGGARRAAVQAQLAVRVLRHHTAGIATTLLAMRAFGPELVVCHSLQRLLHGIAARAVLRSKLVLYLHNTSEVDALARLPLLRLLLRAPDRVAAVSPEIARRLAAWLPADRIWLTSTGVDTDMFQDRGRPRRPQLVTVAHFKWTKGYRYLLDAAARVFGRFPDHRLLLVGDGEERETIVAEIARRGLGGHVVLTGVLSRAAVAQVLNESRLFVLSSLHEGLPKALLEALACGTPAVVTDACNAEGIIDRTGLSVPPRDPAALAAAITTLLTDGPRWERCARNGPEVAARYDWKVVAARDLALYRTLLASPAPWRDAPPDRRADVDRAPGARSRASRPPGGPP